jgi:hypothetical protein
MNPNLDLLVDVSFEVMMAVKMLMLVFWVTTPCVHLQGSLKMEAVCFPETLVCTYKSTRRYNPEDSILIFTAVRTSDLIHCFPIMRTESTVVT